LTGGPSDCSAKDIPGARSTPDSPLEPEGGEIDFPTKSSWESKRMSRRKNDRTFQSESGKTFQDLDTEGFVRAIALALKAEIGATPSALKTVAQLTHSNERAVRNWLEGKNGPSGSNLVILMRHSDRVLKTVLGLADRRGLILAVGLTGLRQRLIDAVAEIDSLPLWEKRGR
jgi:hypothetical protein